MNCLVLLLALCAPTALHAVFMNKTGCGSSKLCLFKPAGCDPNLDCTIGVILYAVGANEMRVEMVATSLIPKVQQQYVAIAFSHDQVMGEDAVTECVMSDMGSFSGYEPDVFVSYNKGKSNDRVFLNDDEHRGFFSRLESEVVDGRLLCHFSQQIIPSIDNKNGQIWDLNKEYYLMAATGSAQPDEVNAHDMNRASHFFPITSQTKVNPSLFNSGDFDISERSRNRVPPLEVSTPAPPPSPPKTEERPQFATDSASNIFAPLLILAPLLLCVIELL